MGYADQLRAIGIQVPYDKTAGQHKLRCPRCAADAKHRNKMDLSVDIDNGQWRCHNTPECNYRGTVQRINIPEKTYVKPTPRTNHTPLHQSVVDWFAGRAISQQTLLARQIQDGLEWMPPNKHAAAGETWTIQFPYYDQRGELVNIKYRSEHKQFRFVKDAKLIMSNLNNIAASDWCIVVEGEIDELTFVEAGYINHVTSVPNGASASDNTKLEYLDNCWEVFENKEKIILATDDDIPGRALRAELIRRFGAERCWTVKYGEWLKDINEHVIGKVLDDGTVIPGHGILSVDDVIEKAEPCPIEGVFEQKDLHAQLMELYQNGLPMGDGIGIRDTDLNIELLFFLIGQMSISTGAPNSGKSDYLDQVICKLAIQYGWKFLVFSPENFPTALHVSKLIEKITGKHFANFHSNIGRITVEDIERTSAFIYDHFYFMNPLDESITIDKIHSTAKKMIRRYGIRGIVIDPWNTIEHRRPRGVNSSEYIGETLERMAQFNRANQVHTFLVAHPSKPDSKKSKKEQESITLYDIADSAHFNNKADNGWVLRRNYQDWTTKLVVTKVKQKHQGQVGSVVYTYNKLNGRFIPIHQVDTADWLLKKDSIDLQPALALGIGPDIITGDSNEPNPLD